MSRDASVRTSSKPGVYAHVDRHRAMIDDDTRNAAYERALRAAITPDSVVLDLGAGLGIHGLLAARLGAKRVYLVEPHDVIQIAQQVAHANGLSDRVVCRQGRIEEITLPERVDVIVSALTGNLLFEEDLLPTLFHARDRWLKTDGRLIPDSATLDAVPVSATAYYQRHIETWSESKCGLDFADVRAFATNTIFQDQGRFSGVRYLADPRTLQHVDLRTANSADCHATAEYQATVGGTCHGCLGWCSIRLGDEWLSTAPHAPNVHWSPVFLPVAEPILLQPDDALRLRVTRPAHGCWSWRVSGAASDQKHSTVLSRPLPAQLIEKQTTAYRPALSAHGTLVRDILARFDGHRTVQQISQEIAATRPEGQPGVTELSRLVADLAQRCK